MEETRKWEEARVTIDILSKTIDFDVYWVYNEDDYDERPDEIIDLDFDLHNMDFNTFLALNEVVDDYYDCRTFRAYRLKNGEVITFIE